MSVPTSARGRPELETACPSAIRDKLTAFELHDVVLGNVVAQCVEQPRGHHLRAGGEPFIAQRIEAQEIELTLAVGHQQTGIRSEGLHDQDLQGRPRRRWIGVARTTLQFLDGHASRAVTVDIPLAVHDIAERVDGPRRDDAVNGMALAGLPQ